MKDIYRERMNVGSVSIYINTDLYNSQIIIVITKIRLFKTYYEYHS